MTMKKMIALKLLIVSLFMMSFPVKASAQATEEIKFQKGRYSKTVSGRVAKDSTKTYYLALKRNQRLKVKFTSKKQYVYITIKDNSFNPIKEDTKGSVEIKTNYDGNYFIEISTKYGQADNFTFIVEAR